MAGDSDIPLTKEDFLLGRYDPSTHPDFIVIEPKYADKEGMMLQKNIKHFYNLLKPVRGLVIRSVFYRLPETFPTKNIYGKINGMGFSQSMGMWMLVQHIRMS
jgi:hypothetical protein